MDIKDIVNKLVMNRYIQDLRYLRVKFSFQTVFRQWIYKYCCCPCAYEHEFMTYISDTGEINGEILNRVIENIINGKCPHVSDVPEDYLRETCVYAIHIASAVGTEKAIRDYLDIYMDSRNQSGIFNLDPFTLAIFKKNNHAVSFICENLPKSYHSHGLTYMDTDVLCASCGFKNTYEILFEKMSIPEYCVRMRDNLLLKIVLHDHIYHSEGGLARALELTFKHGLIEMQKDLLKYIRKMIRGEIFKELNDIPIACILFNKPIVLAEILADIPQGRIRYLISKDTTETCFLLGRRECETVLSSLNFSPQRFRYARRVNSWLRLLDKFSEEFLSEVKNTLRNIPNVENIMNFGETIHCCVCEPVFRKHPLKVVLDLGADINSTDTNHKTPLTILLNHFEINRYDPDGRQAIEMLIDENSSLALNMSAVTIAFRIDENYTAKMEDNNYHELSGKYLIDAKDHSLFGHDGDDYALNFVGPLLIECGFYVRKHTLERALNRHLHSSVIAYIHHCLEQPRSLKNRCRDVLRKHFTGRAIHKFISIAKMPGSIVDFILLKHVLKKN